MSEEQNSSQPCLPSSRKTLVLGRSLRVL